LKQDRTMRYVFVAFCAIAVTFPLLNFYYVFPSFKTLAVEMAESESANMARHISWMVTEDGRFMSPEKMDPIISDIVRVTRGVSRVKVYSSSAVVFYSYPAGFEGDVLGKVDFWRSLQKGNEYSKLKRRGMETTEGEVLDHDALEVYIPIIKNGAFYGALEVYYDLSREVSLVNRVVFRVSAVMLGIMVVGFVTVTFLVLRAGSDKRESIERRMNLRSPAYHIFLMAVTIFATELVIMLILPFIPEASRFGNALIDSFLLLFFISPILYFLLFRPLSWLIWKLERSEAELKVLLQEKEGLMRDMVWRAQSNLSMVQSMLSLHSRKIEDPVAREAVQESEGRIRSMVMVYERLHGSMDFKGVRAKDFFSSLSVRIMRGILVDANRVRLLLEVDDVYLDVDSMVACGLILNELMVNAAKHAFPGERSGEVMVSMKRDDEVEGQVVFSVSDNGVGVPEGFDFRTDGSLGLTLVRAMADQVEGRLACDCTGGTTVSLVFNVKRSGLLAGA